MLTRLLTATVRFKTGDADCSSLIKRILAACWLLDYDTYMWTGNERQILAAHGFERRNLYKPERGDVLWRDGHTEMYLGESTCGGARIDETGGVTGPQSGDQTGWEVASGPYHPARGAECWRYVGDKTVGGWESVSLHWYVEIESAEETMDCIISIQGKNTLVWFDGSDVNDLTTPADVTVIDKIAKACYGSTLPRVTLSEEEYARLCQCIRGGFPKHLKALTDKYPPRSPEE